MKTAYSLALQVIGKADAPATMEAGGQEWPVLGMVELSEGYDVPLLDVPMMSDFKWQLTALEGRLKDREMYAKVFGEDVEAVIADLLQWLWEHLDQAAPRERQRFERMKA